MDKYSGKILYEYSDSKRALDMTKSERRRYIKSFTAVWIMICVLLLTAWCIVNCVLDVRLYGSSAVQSYVFMFILLGVIILITVLTVFGLWGIFLRKVSKSYRPREIESRRRMEELQREGYQRIDCYGVSFFRKDCEVRFGGRSIDIVNSTAKPQHRAPDLIPAVCARWECLRIYCACSIPICRKAFLRHLLAILLNPF